jgi:hypothetical protein
MPMVNKLQSCLSWPILANTGSLLAHRRTPVRQQSLPATVRAWDKQSVMHAKCSFTGLVSQGGDGLCITF